MFAARASSVSVGLGRRAASSIALKYANAAYTAALKKSPQTLTKVQTELAALSKTLKEVPELSALVTNPTLSLQERTKALPPLLAKVQGPKKEPVSDVTKNLLSLLSENGRLAETESIIESFNELVAKYNGELNVIVTSAAPLPKDVLSRLETTLKSSQTAKEAKSVNPSVLGGLVVDFGEKSVDLSVSSRISKLNNLLTRALSRFDCCVRLV
ncbi:OSCP/delta subunit of ATPase [Vararia minispora EC-137]|uniref:OSCP/delta subunit of ATPase n=1 Tax=Vararia minispora EC-137 TaxID=1314806 RepID=A0ACB8QWM1_9AGAM|nr:OSCP/delta subunit of ATPase [Vararia minispora EC-137]